MSGKKTSTAGIIFTCHEKRSGFHWKYICMAWGEVIASGIAPTQAAARQKNREAKEEYRKRLDAGEFVQTVQDKDQRSFNIGRFVSDVTGQVRPNIQRL